MSDVIAETPSGEPEGPSSEERRGFFARILLFFRQVIDELKKVVRPTRKELLRFTLVVLVFVVIMMGIVSLLDWVFGLAAFWAFSN